jgi:FtsH-binding integral membrane protein
MAYEVDPIAGASRFDPGLDAFLARAYVKLAGGCLASAVVAGFMAELEPLRAVLVSEADGGSVLFSRWGGLVLIAPLPILLLATLEARLDRPKASGLLYWLAVSLIGGSLGLLGSAYAGASPVSTLLSAAAAFVGLALWGGAAKRHLSDWGDFLLFAAIGGGSAVLANAATQGSTATLAVDIAGILVFAGLVATDNRRLKRLYFSGAEPEALRAGGDYAALTLFLNLADLVEAAASLLKPKPPQ